MFTQKDFKDLYIQQELYRPVVVVNRWHILTKKNVPYMNLRGWGIGLHFAWYDYFRGVNIAFLCFEWDIGIYD
jgi:hypothetical protein